LKATSSRGTLRQLPNCYINIPSFGQIPINNLPDISDSKSAVYDSTPIIGRSSPLHSYHYSDTRIINVTLHFFIVGPGDAEFNLSAVRAIQSCAYPKEGGSGGAPFSPPEICSIRCGNLLATSDLCVVLQSYNVRWSTDTVWDEATMCPYKFDVDTTWWVVYSSSQLPFNTDIISSGR
jgi:hypothetical protein